jgi:hypothetical protein
MRRTLMGACAIAAVCGWPAGAADEPVSALETNRRIVLRRHEASVQAYQGNADVLVLPGLVADRKARRILLDVATTGVEKGKPIEFWLIGDTSGHGYESLAMAFAKPSAVHRALEFIGLKPGRPVNANAMQFWSKGERVFVSLTRAAGDPPEKAVRMESLLHDTRTGKPLAETGFAFTGSVQVPPEKARDGNRYGADLFEPNSIASTYNEMSTVLDVPRRAPKRDVYETQVVADAGVFPPDQLRTAVLVPEYADGKRRVVETAVEVKPVPGALGNDAKSLTFRFTNGGASLTTNDTLNAMLQAVLALTSAGHDVHASVTFSPDLRLGAARSAANLISLVDTEKGLRVEAPPAGQLYYRAYLPDEKLRARENRTAQPWELHLGAGKDGLTASLVKVNETWPEGSIKPVLSSESLDVRDGAALKRAIETKGAGLPVLLVFAESAMRLGDAMAFVSAVAETHPTVFFYLEPESK